MKSRLVLSVVALLATTTTALGQTSEILRLVPEDGLGFAIVHHLDRLEKEIVAQAQKMGTPLPAGPLAQLKQMFGINNGLDEKGTAAILVLPGEQILPGVFNEPHFVGVVPVSKYETFLAELNAKEGPDKIATVTLPTGEQWLIARRASFRSPMALIALAEHRKSLEKVLKTRTRPSKALQPLQKWLTEVDGAAVILKPGVKRFVDLMVQEFEQSKAFIDPTDPNQKYVATFLDAYINAIRSINHNVSYTAIGGSLNKSKNLQVGMRVGFMDGGSYAKAMKDSPATKKSPLTGLPGGPFAMALGGNTPKSMLQSMIDLNELVFEVSKDRITGAERREMLRYFETTLMIKNIAWVVGPPSKEAASIFENTVVVVTVEDAAKYLDNFEKGALKAQQIMAKIAPEEGNQIVSVQRIKGAAVLALKAEYKVVNVNPNDQVLWEALIGNKAGYTSTLAAIDDNTVLMTMKPVKDLAKFIKEYKAAAAMTDQQEVKKLVSKLPANAQFIMMVNGEPIAKMAMTTFRKFNPGIVQNLPAFPPSPPAGIGIAMSSDGLEAEVVVPISLIQNSAAYVQKLLAR